MNDDACPSLDDLVEQCILAHEDGGDEAVRVVLAAHPEHAAELQRRLDQLARLGILAAPASGAKIPEQLGDFRLLHQIGRGGMGIVYLAEQESLERQVALKLVHPEQLFFAGARERFRREVLAIARLHHPGIVPILTGGEAEGIPFYAMELVHGASLAEVLQELVGTAPTALHGRELRIALARGMARKHDREPVPANELFEGNWPQVCARLLLQACEAVQHAHAQGVLHRDLKPSNLLLTNEGNVRVIDFGLAATSGGDRITRSGATLGSLPYMAPEQVRGRAHELTERTDVYQLGVTLYELLTTRLPHGNGNEDTRARIVAGHVAPPSQDNAHVHPDLDAICLRAFDVDPNRRYPGTAAFAADLLAFLEQRTVQARRPSALVRAQRWVRRRPSRAAILAIAVVMFVIAPLVFAFVQQAANSRIRQALVEAERQRSNAERNFDEALRSVDLMLLRTSDARLAEIPRTSQLRQQLVRDAIDVHERLVTSTTHGGDRLLRARARSELRLGQLHTEVGQLTTAEQVLQACEQHLRQLLAADDDDDDDDLQPRYDLARCQQALATIFARTARKPAAMASLTAAVDGYERVSNRSTEDKHRRAWLQGRLTLAGRLASTGERQAAQRMFDDLDRDLSLDIARELPRKQLEDRVRMHAAVARGRGILAAQFGDPADAVVHLQTALARATALPADATPSRKLHQQNATCAEQLGILLHQRRMHEDAAKWIAKATHEYDGLIAREPDVPRWRAAQARILGVRAANNRYLGKPDDALRDHDRAIELLQDIVAAAPEDYDHQRELALSYAERATHFLAIGNVPAALQSFAVAADHFDPLLELAPEDQVAHGNYAVLLANYAMTLAENDDYAEARRKLAKALVLQRGLPGDANERSVIEMLGAAAEYALIDHDETAARSFMQQAEDRAQRWLNASPQDPTRVITATLTATNKGRMLMAMEQSQQALQTWEQAVTTARRAAATRYGQRQLCLLQLRISEACVRLEQLPRARQWFQRAVADGATRAMAAMHAPFAALFDRDDLR